MHRDLWCASATSAVLTARLLWCRRYNCTEIYVQALAGTGIVLVGVVPAVQRWGAHRGARIVDHMFREAFFQQGRETFTFDVKPVSTMSRMMLCTSMAVVVPKLTVWQLGSIWVSEAEVLATPRMDFSHITHYL